MSSAKLLKITYDFRNRKISIPEEKQLKTRRERLKSALYLKLKKRKVFEIVKGGPFRLFENTVCCKISKKIEGDHLETFKNLKMKNENFETVS